MSVWRDPVTRGLGLVLRTNGGSAAFLEVLVLHLAEQFPSTRGDRSVVVERSSRAPRPPSGGSGALLDAVLERLLAQGAVDRVIDARSHARARGDLVLCHASPAVLGLAAASSEHVLVIEDPVFFHCSGPNWVDAAIDLLESDPKLLLVRTRRGPPGAARSAAGRVFAPAGYFLCEKTRLHAKLGGAGRFALEGDRTGTRRGSGSLEQCVEHRASGNGRFSAELESTASWALRAPYTGDPFPAWAAGIAAAVARGNYPELQRERSDIRLDRARDREAWGSLVTGTKASSGLRREAGTPLGPHPGGALNGVRLPERAPSTPARAESFGPRARRRVEPALVPNGAPRVVLLAPYLTRNGNPLLGRPQYAKDRDELIEPWWSDVDRLGLHARIFHDELSDGFIERYTTAHIAFERSKLPPRVSCNDHRFRLFRDWLRSHPEVEHLFCTDLFDLRVKKNPFELFGAAPYIYAGAQPSSIGRNLYVRTKLFRAYGRQFPELSDKVVLNAGILGGPRELLLPCLDAIVGDLEAAISAQPAGNHNMGVFNRVLHGLDRVWARGAPLHSRFRAHDHGADVCFVHK